MLGYRFDLEVYRFILYFSLFSITSIWANLLHIPGVPNFYVELILLAPVLRYRWANILMSLSILTAIIRVIQGFYGFDQMFVSTYLLLRNMSGAPLWSALYYITTIALTVCMFFYGGKIIPRMSIRVSIQLFLIISLCCFVVKLQEDKYKSNLIGTSFGYLFGQLQFSKMFYGPYEIPMLSNERYPASLGADYALERGTNFVVIIVESMGVPHEDSDKERLFSTFYTKEILKKYHAIEGVVPSRGSTIHGEIRELCGGRLSKGLFGGGEGCIPKNLTEAGYHTEAIHANHRQIYGRNEWYPAIGFQRYINTDTGELPKDQIEDHWGSALDTSLINWLNTRVEKEGRHFEYILTVSTHLPAVPIPDTVINESCLLRLTESACIHLANLDLVLTAIASYAEKKVNTTFVVVGDHPPPFISSASVRAFQNLVVPYIILKPKLTPIDD